MQIFGFYGFAKLLFKKWPLIYVVIVWKGFSGLLNFQKVYLACPLSVFMKGWLIWFDFDLNLIAQRDRSDGTRPKKKTGRGKLLYRAGDGFTSLFWPPQSRVHSFWAITIFLEFAAHLTLDFVARPLSCHLLGQLTTVTRSTTKEMSKVLFL